jgi:hypothetical protein
VSALVLLPVQLSSKVFRKIKDKFAGVTEQQVDTLLQQLIQQDRYAAVLIAMVLSAVVLRSPLLLQHHLNIEVYVYTRALARRLFKVVFCGSVLLSLYPRLLCGLVGQALPA